MKRILIASALCLAGALAMTACTGLKTAVSTVGGAVYNVAADAVTDYCSLSDAQRAAVQLVVAGKVYNSGLCKVVNGDKALVPVLAVTEPDKVPAALDAAISNAVSNGELSQAQAEDIHAAPVKATAPTIPATPTGPTEPEAVPAPVQARPPETGVTTAQLLRPVCSYA